MLQIVQKREVLISFEWQIRSGTKKVQKLPSGFQLKVMVHKIQHEKEKIL